MIDEQAQQWDFDLQFDPDDIPPMDNVDDWDPELLLNSLLGDSKYVSSTGVENVEKKE